MRICAAQTRPVKGDLPKNIEHHKKLVTLAAANGADVIIFPELSVTGYEPELAKDLAISPDDKRLDSFQEISDAKQIVIGVGVPLKACTGVTINTLFFQPHQTRKSYSKQHLHPDEYPYFVSGQYQLYLTVKNNKIAPAICYESLVPEHSERAFRRGAEIYFASVAKSSSGVEKAFKHFSDIAGKYSMTVLMANCVGYCDNFISAGKTAVWNNKGLLAGQLNDTNEGILIFDTHTQELIEKVIN